MTQKTPREIMADQMQRIGERMKSVGNTLIVLSGKGGVGKSTVSVNIACALAGRGLKTGLLDVDLHGPSIPGMLGISSEQIAGEDGAMIPVRTGNGLKVMSVGLMTKNEDDAVIWRGPMKYGVIRQFLADVEWGELDYLIIDSPPGTGDEPLGVIQSIGSPDGGIIVTTPQKVALSDVRRSITFCRKLSLPVTGIVENMNGFVCPDCGKTTYIFNSEGGKRLADELEIPFLGSVPLDPAVVKAGDDGVPLTGGGDSSPAAGAFDKIVDRIINS